MRKLFRKLKSLISSDIGIDLGTANTLVYVRGLGIVLNEPSVVAINAETHKVLAVGREAKRMLGRCPGKIKAIRPMKEGVIADFEVTEQMLRYFIVKVHRRRLMQPRVLVAVPTGITEVETRAVKESAIKAGARCVELIEEPKAAALGVGLPIDQPVGNMIVDIGGGTTEVAVLSLNGIVESCSVRQGGDAMDDAIMRMVKRAYSLSIGERAAEEIKISAGSAYPLPQEIEIEVKGRDLNSGLPKTISIRSEEIRQVLVDEVVKDIVAAVRGTLDRTQPALAADLIDHGIVLAGGGSLLRGIDQLIAEETGLPVTVADQPLMAVAKGTGIALDYLDLMDGN